MTMARTLDTRLDAAIAEATLELLEERGFATMTMEAVAERAGVGKPAIYRRHRDKASLVVAVIDATQMDPIDVGDLGDTRAELWLAVERGPADAERYLRLIGGLIAEQERHPELISTFRQRLLGPRRAIVLTLIERGQARGEVRGDLDPVQALDLLAGPALARAFAGLDTGPRWREDAFATWWNLIGVP